MRRVTFGYAGALLAWNLLRLTPLAGWGPFEFADMFGWLLLLPLPVIGVALFLRRSWGLLPVLLLPIGLFAVEYGPQFMPHRVPRGDALRVATANLYFRNAELGGLDRMVERVNADVLAVQELNPTMNRRLLDRLGGRYPHRALYPRTDSNGLGILSKYPIRETEAPRMARGSCRCQAVILESGNEDVTFINAHPLRPRLGFRQFDASVQISTVEALLRTARNARGRVLVVGDLNIADRHQLFRRIRADLGDAYRDAGWGLGLTWAHMRKWRLVRIDYVLHDHRWRTKVAATGTIPGSDHRYVVADLVAQDARR